MSCVSVQAADGNLYLKFWSETRAIAVDFEIIFI